VDQKQSVARLEKANKYRDFARWVGDRETVQRILALTVELKQTARALAKPNEEKFESAPGNLGRKQPPGRKR